MKFQFLTENKTDREGILAEHGLSIYIETSEKTILFDSGFSDVFAMNAERMAVDLKKVDLAVVSHGHADHTGGLPLFCRINEVAPVYIHRNAFRRSHGFSNGKIEEEMCGIRWSDEQKDLIRERMKLTESPVYITDDIIISGTIPVEEGFKPSERFYYYNLDGKPVEDDMSHEQCLVIREEEGLYIFSGCSHRGVISAVNAAKNLFPGERISTIVAGMHLYGADEPTRERVVKSIISEDVDRLMPVHCTGMDAICMIKNAMGEKCVIAQAGDSFDGC